MRLSMGLSSTSSGPKTQGDSAKTTPKETMEAEEYKERGAVQDKISGRDKTGGEGDPLRTRGEALPVTVQTESSRASCLNLPGIRCIFYRYAKYTEKVVSKSTVEVEQKPR